MPVANTELLKEIRIMATKLESVTDTLNNLETKLDNEVHDINNQIQDIHTQFTKAMLEVKNELDHELRLLNERINGLKIANNESKKSLELTVSGIPEMDGDKLQSSILRICSLIRFDDAKSIVDVHRLMHTNQTTLSPISNVIVCFATTTSRRLFHSRYFAFIKADPLKLSHIGIDSQSRIYVNENLSKQCLEVLKSAKLLKKNGKIAGVHTYDGQVYVFPRDNQQFEIVSNISDLSKYE